MFRVVRDKSSVEETTQYYIDDLDLGLHQPPFNQANFVL